MKYLLNFSYDGSKFYGFQKQRKFKTVQGDIENCISVILNNKINIIGASRTDRGVHAVNQFAHFESKEIKNEQKFLISLNKLIDKSIYIKSIKRAEEDFSARYSVKMKGYIYKINVGDYNPIEKDYVYQYNKPINIKLLKKASKKLEGIHDFKSFTSDNEKESYIRKVDKIKIIKAKNSVYIKIKARSLLRYMIRNIVGTLLEINEGKKKIEDLENIIASRDRKICGKTISPCGLYLNKIKY